jgi:hypothetical protein
MVQVAKSKTSNVPKNRWIASLSNGETIFEDIIEGQPPAWERLARYVELHNLSITCLRAQMGAGEVSLPKNQDGYIQKKKMWSTGATGGKMLCIGNVQGGRAVIHELSQNMGSHTVYVDDPGEPWTIYKASLREEHARATSIA